MYFKIFLICLTLVACSISKAIDDDKSFNPQPCNKTNHGKIKLFKDRQSKDKLLFCTADHGFYSWKAVDGSQSRGEFFDPAYDCSDVLNNVNDARDGFYWINFGISNMPRKVWCDMTTDGGGYMLIGRKRNASMWSVPSNDETVTPFGSPHWTSAFGDAPILDFRVQMATKESFSDTKAHWSFRLKAKRLLKSLLAIGKGGCDQSSAGIGNIAYVKDLQTESIVTTNFQCSKFGFAHQPSLKFGWSMMNSCLQKPCSNGFAFLDHPNIKWQTDTSGAFSYSVTGNVSGIHHDSTAFVGCDNKCCACYGPLGGTGNYCGNDCQAKPGGTVTKNVYTWFWVRSTLPKRVWSKCMEYQVTADNGDIVWYKLKDGSGVPKKGRCSKNKVLLNDGIAVVPDSAAAKKIPSVPGLLEYRKDNKKLYVRANKTWNVVAEEEKVVNILNTSLSRLQTRLENHLSRVETRLDNLVNTDLSRVETELRNVNQTLRKVINGIMSDHFSSVILVRRPRFRQLIEQWLPVKAGSHLCWRASRDGWAASAFHSRCDNKGPTVTIVRVGQYIFGGYNDLSWTGSGSYKSSSNAFLFSLRNKDNLKAFKALVYRYSHTAIYDSSSYGPTFGSGHDLHIANNAHSSTSSYTNFGYTYQSPSGYSYGSSNTRALLAGSYKFTPSEVEVFYFG